MAGAAWPDYAPAPIRYGIWLVTTSVGGEPNPFHGARAPLIRYQQWYAALEWGNQRYFNNLSLESHFSRSDGGSFIFRVPIFKYRDMRGNKTGGVSLAGAHPAGAVVLNITGGSGTLLAGDWVSINQGSGVPRAYQVVSSESGGAIGIRPGLRIAYNSGAVVQHLNNASPGYIEDTMELLTEEGAMAEVSSAPKVTGPLMVEFASALRVSP